MLLCKACGLSSFSFETSCPKCGTFIADKTDIVLYEEKRMAFIDLLIKSYDIRQCPSCFENKMILSEVSPTGRSVEYKCENCNKGIRGKFISDSLPDIVVTEYQSLKKMIGNIDPNFLKKLNVPISFSFHVATPFVESFQRKPIPENIRNEVWRRDQGKCTSCSSQINLEFDHIIPLSKGGSSTARNLQLLCEKCNRQKSAKI